MMKLVSSKRFNVASLIVAAAMAALLPVAGVLGGSRVAYAAGTSGSCVDEDSNFLSFPTWYRHLCNDQGQIEFDKELGKSIIVIALNVVDIALRLASLVAIAFVIWGGFQYLLARGEPSNLTKAKLSIEYAIGGLVICMMASALVGFIAGNLAK